MTQPRQPIESGVPDPFPWMHPIMKKNYGNWKYHERPRPGVLRHVAHGGEAQLHGRRLQGNAATSGMASDPGPQLVVKGHAELHGHAATGHLLEDAAAHIDLGAYHDDDTGVDGL